jgi:hypothetical protein
MFHDFCQKRFSERPGCFLVGTRESRSRSGGRLLSQLLLLLNKELLSANFPSPNAAVAWQRRVKVDTLGVRLSYRSHTESFTERQFSHFCVPLLPCLLFPLSHQLRVGSQTVFFSLESQGPEWLEWLAHSPRGLVQQQR